MPVCVLVRVCSLPCHGRRLGALFRRSWRRNDGNDWTAVAEQLREHKESS